MPPISWEKRVRRNCVVDPLFRHLGIQRMEEQFVSLKSYLLIYIYLNKHGMLKYLYKSSVQWYQLGKEVKFSEVHTLCVSCSVLGGYLLTFREKRIKIN